MKKEDREREKKLLQLVQDALAQDAKLRDKYQVGEKFRFIRDRLQALSARLEEQVKATEEVLKKAEKQAPDEVLVHVYLYNAQGMLFPTWQKMVSASVLYEYSVNRPIYADKSLIEAYIRSKSNKSQHAYLSIAVKPMDIINKEIAKDALGAPLIKMREGCLLFNKLVLFTHNGHQYAISDTGVLTKKQD